jgi:aryl-phospho-beta-D-glucosidase BglC (GH1 family)
MHPIPTPITNVSLLPTIMDTYVDDRTRAGGFPAVQLPTDVIPELVTNGSLPTTTTGWSLCGSPTSHLLSVVGGGGFSISNRTATTQGIQTTICPVNGVMYTFRVRAKTSSSTPVNVGIGVKIVGPTGTTTYPPGASKTESIAGDWRWITFTWKATVGCGSGTIYMYLNGSPVGVTIYSDRLSVEGPVASYVPTPIPHFVKRVGNRKEIGTSGKVFTDVGENLNVFFDSDMTDPNLVYNLKYWDWRDVFGHLRALGFNSVRLCLWYRLFESDAAPGVWDETGFAWLNTIIVRARNHGIAVLLDMHGPQAGYQSADYSGDFWGTDPIYRNRLKALWVEIANRYKDEPFVIGYDLINEPCCSTTAQLAAYLLEVRAAVKAVDPNHLFHFETNFGDDGDYVVPVGASDIVADSHSYPGVTYSESLIVEKTNTFTGLKYPETVKKVPLWPSSMNAGVSKVGQTTAVAEGSSGWYWVSYTMPAPGVNAACFCPAVLTKNSTGGIFVERFKVYEDAQQLDHYMIEKTPSNTWDYQMWENPAVYGFSAAALDPNVNFYASAAWPKLGTCTVSTVTTPIENGKTSLKIVSGLSGTYRGVYSSKRQYSVDSSKTYRVDALVYLGTSTVLADVQVGGVWFDAKYPEESVVFDSANLIPILDCTMEASSPDFPSYLTKYDVLGCMGEYGVSAKMYQGWGAEVLLTDVINWCLDNNVAIYLFEYRGTYGLYYGSTRGYPSDGLCLANTAMLNAVEAVLA